MKFTSLTSTGWVKILAWSLVWSWSRRALSKILKGVSCISRRASCCLICGQTQNYISAINLVHFLSPQTGRRFPTTSLRPLPLPSWASPACGWAPAAAGPAPGHGGGDAIPSAAPWEPGSPLRFGPLRESQERKWVKYKTKPMLFAFCTNNCSSH